jgi:transcriptional regulator with XRE-family HTH domain
MNIFLRRTRVQAGLTQEQLASALGTTPISIWRWESGKNMPSYYFRAIICAYFKRPPTAFGWPLTSNRSPLDEAGTRIYRCPQRWKCSKCRAR